MATADNPRRVLVVDDDVDIRDALRLALEGEGYAVTTAANGAVALELLRDAADAPTVILLDLRMPVMDGWTFCEARRDDARLANIPVVVISGEAGVSRTAPYADVAAVLAKPVEPDVLLSVVERLASGPVA